MEPTCKLSAKCLKADEGLEKCHMPYFLAASNTSSSDNTPTWYIDLMLSMVTKTVGEEHSSEMECHKAFNLLLAILLNFHCLTAHDGTLATPYLSLINNLVLAKLAQCLGHVYFYMTSVSHSTC